MICLDQKKLVYGHVFLLKVAKVHVNNLVQFLLMFTSKIYEILFSKYGKWQRRYKQA